MAGTRRFRRNRRSKKSQNAERGNGDQGDARGPNYTPIVKENADFLKYYKAQNIVDESEWEVFVESLRSDLPTAFRVSSCNRAEAKRLLEIIKSSFFDKLINVDENDEAKKKPFCLSWYPGQLAWQVELSRKDIRRCEEYFRLHNFLILETQAGCISRQETVSMIPPIVLDIQPHHRVLDMCAAPGSKTAQLVEFLHSGTDETPSGFVVANDIDNSRCYMLVHQAKRLNSPCVVITNHDASCMPNFYHKNNDSGEEEILKFDRVLCDVPCTGDGTLRKNPDIWLKWNSANGNNLHGVQYRVLQRGLEMLRVGGRLVYSTCSFNPVENEAVIQRMLLHANGSVELVEFADMLPGLRYRRGLSTWKAASPRDMTLYDSFDQVGQKWHTIVRPQMFPQDNRHLNLDRCLRVLPHEQNTGGFFVAVLTKKALLPWEKGGKGTGAPKTEKESSDKADGPVKDGADVGEEGGVTDAATAGEGHTTVTDVRKPPRKKPRIQGYREDPFIFFKQDEPIWAEIKEFYDVRGLETSCLLTRCLVGKKKNIYYVTPTLRDLVDLNQTKLKIINTGVKVFSRCDSRAADSNFRFVQEGLESIHRFVGPRRRVSVTTSDLLLLLANIDPKFPPQTDSLQQETQDKLLSIGQGSCIIDYRDEGLDLSLVGWKGVRSLRAYVPLADAAHYLRLIGGDASIYERNKYKKDEGGREDVPNSEASSVAEAEPSDGTPPPDEEAAKEPQLGDLR